MLNLHSSHQLQSLGIPLALHNVGFQWVVKTNFLQVGVAQTSQTYPTMPNQRVFNVYREPIQLITYLPQWWAAHDLSDFHLSSNRMPAGTNKRVRCFEHLKQERTYYPLLSHRIHVCYIYGNIYIHLPSIYPSHVSIYTSTMDPLGI